MIKKVILIMIMIFVNFIFIYSKDINIEIPELPQLEEDMIPPTLPKDDLLEVDNEGKIIGKRVLEENTTVYLESKVNIFVPLEIISDVDIETLVVDNQKLEIPFEVELNRVPEKKDYYRLHYSETEIDIDEDGQTDTYIYSSPFINTRIKTDNLLYIDGEKISKEGTFKKKVYMTIEIRE